MERICGKTNGRIDALSQFYSILLAKFSRKDILYFHSVMKLLGIPLSDSEEVRQKNVKKLRKIAKSLEKCEKQLANSKQKKCLHKNGHAISCVVLHSTYCTVHEGGPYTSFFSRFELRQSKKGTEVSSISQEIHSIPHFMNKDDIILLQFFTWFCVHVNEAKYVKAAFLDPLSENHGQVFKCFVLSRPCAASSREPSTCTRVPSFLFLFLFLFAQFCLRVA